MALKTTLPSFLLFYLLLSLLPSQNSNKMPDTCLGLGYMVIKQTDLVPTLRKDLTVETSTVQ